MQRIEYRTADKSEWGEGPWQNEPDKVQWLDPETNYPCLIVRNQLGALCGYVGVPDGHPCRGKDGHDCSGIEAHGGLTFAGGCMDLSRDHWIRHARFVRSDQTKAEAKRHPKGDYAKEMREWGHVIGDYNKWREQWEARAVCHKVEPGESDNIWWLGFDCAHAWDFIPGLTFHQSRQEEVYRDIAYVTTECEKLAKQLLKLEEENG